MRLKPLDLPAVIVGAGLVTLSWWTAGRGGHGEVLELQAGDGPPRRAALDGRRRLEVDGPLGTTVIEIRGGRARIASSPCRGKLCVLAGWLDRDGDTAVCVPNRVSLMILGRDRRFDALNY